VGGWATLHHRSYFAARLPADWWIFGVDELSGLGVDEAQVRYFAEVAAGLGPGASWV
jgi:hypothetical protein